jgi:lipoyl(octanoyl) transferase
MVELLYRDLGRMGYGECWDLQRLLFARLLDSKSSSGQNSVTLSDSQRADILEWDKIVEANCGGELLIVEHNPVYTLGKSGKLENMLVSEQYLRSIGAEFYRIERGGDVTYHGPGQIVGYPILDLEKLGIGLRQYIDSMEQAIIEVCAEWGVEAGRIEGASGVWIEPQSPRARKICAIGVRSSRYVTMHGFAFNVATDLRYFSYINPCGFVDKGVTSLEKELGHKVDFEQVKLELLNQLKEKLDVKIYK